MLSGNFSLSPTCPPSPSPTWQGPGARVALPTEKSPIRPNEEGKGEWRHGLGVDSVRSRASGAPKEHNKGTRLRRRSQTNGLFEKWKGWTAGRRSSSRGHANDAMFSMSCHVAVSVGGRCRVGAALGRRHSPRTQTPGTQSQGTTTGWPVGSSQASPLRTGVQPREGRLEQPALARTPLGPLPCGVLLVRADVVLYGLHPRCWGCLRSAPQLRRRTWKAEETDKVAKKQAQFPTVTNTCLVSPSGPASYSGCVHCGGHSAYCTASVRLERLSCNPSNSAERRRPARGPAIVMLCSCPMYFNTVCDRWEWKCMAGTRGR
jgi:hypothetical protein